MSNIQKMGHALQIYIHNHTVSGEYNSIVLRFQIEALCTCHVPASSSSLSARSGTRYSLQWREGGRTALETGQDHMIVIGH